MAVLWDGCFMGWLFYGLVVLWDSLTDESEP
jgi:hypothetical protein